MIGYLFDYGDRALKALASLWRKPDPRIPLLAVRSAAKDALRRAEVRGDTRRINEHREALKRATTNLLRAELSQGQRRVG